MQRPQSNHTDFCWICGKAVELETCKIDEHGMAVHEDCYVLSVARADGATRMMVRKPAHRITALWYLISGRSRGPS